MPKSDIETELEEAKAEVAACLEFLDTELGWEYFREEMLYFDNEEQRSASMRNAQKLKNFLAEKGHGIRLLRELRELRELPKHAQD